MVRTPSLVGELRSCITAGSEPKKKKKRDREKRNNIINAILISIQNGCSCLVGSIEWATNLRIKRRGN